jgi:hypothetical protein
MLGFVKLVSNLNKYGIPFEKNAVFHATLELGNRFHVLTGGSMKMAVIWVVPLCRLVVDRPDDGGSKHM